MTDLPQSASATSGGHQIRIGAIVALLVVIGLVVWLLVRTTNSTPSQTTGTGISPIAVSLAGLRTISSAAQQPIFWVGRRANTTFELQQTANGTSTYLRYLPKGVAVGSAPPQLTVGTYDLADAYAVVGERAKSPGSVRVPLGPDAVAYYSPAHPGSVFVAFETSPYAVEVYSPVAGQAKQLVSDGDLGSINGVTGMGAVAATPAEITAIARELHHPLYWLGPAAHDTYELTEEADGSVYIRYLPPGVSLGARTRELTVGTYPMSHAYAVTAKTAQQAGERTIPLPDAVASYALSSPQSVHVAFKGAKIQIEVYDPSAATSRRLVAAGKLAPLGQ